MKDMPALLLAYLSSKAGDAAERIFDRVIDNEKMLRNYVQIMRSGVVGRKSLGSRPKRMILRWLAGRTDEQLFRGSVGNAPSLADVIKMVHPYPTSPTRQALYGWLIGRSVDVQALPAIVGEFEAYKQNSQNAKTPDVPFQMLTSLDLTREAWTEIARNAPWQMTRMNLNTFLRHGVFQTWGMAARIADRLRDPQKIKAAKVFPYQLMVAYRSASSELPQKVREALQDAMEIAIGNVPRIDGKVYVCVDVSGSMHSPATGSRRGATSVVRCIDVAALTAAAILRRNASAEILPFSDDVVQARLNPRGSVLGNANRLARLPAGGTNCSAPLRRLNERKAQGDLVVYVSDNESWIDSARPAAWFRSSATQTMTEWMSFKQRNPRAKLICIDVQPYGTSQAAEQKDVYNVGGFSDAVFDFIADVAQGRASAGYWVQRIEEIQW
jgi:60 kDa SS-A/Ro ribonucleoprotein